ncbi:MAG: IS30 family transposase [Pseudomonadota bacterium]
MKYQHFTIEERESLQYMWWERRSLRSMAKALNRSPSSISRELKRNFPVCRNAYTPRVAHERALAKRKSRGRHDRLKNGRIRQYVITHLKEGWSPEQISGRIKIDLDEKISHEAIYQYIYTKIYTGGIGPRPGCEDLRPYLRRKRKRRLGKGFRAAKRVKMLPGRMIDTRPIIVERRTRIGDWESDTVESCDHKPGINTLVDRKTGFVLITKLNAKTSASTAEAVARRLDGLPAYTITADNGPENQSWKFVETVLNTQWYFANPYHSWERGTNENANGLIREYFPKKTDFTMIPEETLALIEHKLNTRPRKRLNYLTPLEAFSVALAG